MTSIFISYRRDDSRYQADRLYKALTEVLPREHVFMDIDSIRPGDDFVEILEGWVKRCDILLALIGPGWVKATDPKSGKRRLDNTNDFVRIEVREALSRGIPVVPVLLDGAGMPDADALPDDLKKLVRRHAQFVDFRTFDADVATLIKRLELGGPPKVPSPAPESPKPSPPPPAAKAPDRARGAPDVLGKVRVMVGVGQTARETWMKPGESFRDFDIAPEMVVVPRGEFWMGSKDGEGDADERPRHKVTIPQAFAAGKFPVTFAEWDAALSAGGVTHKPETEWGRGRQPVMRVSWDDAQAYVKWLSGKTGQPYRLLSEAEWEYACRAGTETAYSFGNSITKAQAQFSEGSWGSAGKTAEVGSFPANKFGLHDMHGNVWEWCEDCWNDSYKGKPDSLKQSGGAWTTGDCGRRALRGGSGLNYPTYLRSADRSWYDAGDRYGDIGFRLARTLTL